MDAGVDTLQKALQVNLDLRWYGTIAEIGAGLEEVIHALARWGARSADALAAGGAYTDERIMRRANGELFWCRVAGRALRASNPHAVGVWTFEDLSGRRPVAVGMTPREREVAALLLEGQTSKRIARRIDLSPRTVEMHRANLMRKFGVSTSGALLHKLASLN